jgi:hypothetical protein
VNTLENGNEVMSLTLGAPAIADFDNSLSFLRGRNNTEKFINVESCGLNVTQVR